MCDPGVEDTLDEIYLWDQTFWQGQDVVCRRYRPCPFPAQVSGTGLAGRLVSTEALRALTSAHDRPPELISSPSFYKWGSAGPKRANDLLKIM